LKAIVGLGNPGAEYKQTRHNVGFEVVDELARRWTVRLKSWKSMAEVAVVSGRDVVLAEPKTFMNNSGQAVRAVADFYQIDPRDVLVVVDEVQLPLGRLRLRRSGSAGGHNGLKSIIEHLGTEFPRLRLGVGRGDPRRDLAAGLNRRSTCKHPRQARPPCCRANRQGSRSTLGTNRTFRSCSFRSVQRSARKELDYQAAVQEPGRLCLSEMAVRPGYSRRGTLPREQIQT
jgi:PTH1 family peptidyl-tRNA hydrolase